MSGVRRGDALLRRIGLLDSQHWTRPISGGNGGVRTAFWSDRPQAASRGAFEFVRKADTAG